MVLKNIELPMEAIARVCQKYAVEELSVFGSALRDDFGPGSDVDFLVAFRNNECGPWMSKLVEMEQELAALLGKNVDLVNKRGVEQSRNRIRREEILGSARVVYEG
jgi:predicted nucleotidyltransferase